MQRPTSVLLVEDDELLRRQLEQTLRRAGYRVSAVESGETAVAAVARDEPDLMLVDLNLPGMSGIDLCARLRGEGRDVHLLVMTAYTSIPSAVEAIKAGAHDYLVKPLDMEGLLLRLEHVSAELGVRRELRQLKDAVRADRGEGGLLGACPPMRRVFEQLQKAAESPVHVLVTGESGTGKQLVARELHARSQSPDAPFVTLDLSSVADARLEDLLFGGEEGDPGKLAQARGGVLYITELCDLSLAAQERLARFLEASQDADPSQRVRVVAATNRFPDSEIESGSLREDLYYRLSVVTLDLPPLRARRSDLPLLAEHFLAIYSARFGKTISGIEPAAAERLLAYDWPGNVRELRTCIERAVATCKGSQISEAELGNKVRRHTAVDLVVATADPNDWVTLEEVSKLYTRHVMRALKGNKSKAARVLGVDRKTLARKLARWDDED